MSQRDNTITWQNTVHSFHFTVQMKWFATCCTKKVNMACNFSEFITKYLHFIAKLHINVIVAKLLGLI